MGAQERDIHTEREKEAYRGTNIEKEKKIQRGRQRDTHRE